MCIRDRFRAECVSLAQILHKSPGNNLAGSEFETKAVA